MPTFANITVKKADNTTDILWTGIQASGGDRSPAYWRSLTVGTMNLARPEFRVQARANGSGTARWVESFYTYPYVITGPDGKPYVADRFTFSGKGVVPIGMTDTDIAEAAAQAMHLHASVLGKSMFRDGFSAT
jgi:hypothetical protein